MHAPDAAHLSRRALMQSLFGLVLFAGSALAQPTVTVPDQVTLFIGEQAVQLTATGGTGPYTWTSLDPLPAGMEIRTDHPSGNPHLWGVARTVSPFTAIRLRVTDSASASSTKTVQIRVTDLRFTTQFELPDANLGAPYSHTIQAAGGSPPYTFSLQSGYFLPTGLSLSAAGVITGSPTGGGGNFRVVATDAAGVTRAEWFTIRYSPMRFVSTSQILPNAQGGVAYSQTLAFTGGTPPYTLQESCCLPTGLSASLAGSSVVISGTVPSGDWRNFFTPVVRDATGATLRRVFSIAYHTPPKNQPELQARQPESATIGERIQVGYFAARGQAPYTWSLASGTLPPGMSLITNPGEHFPWADPNGAYLVGSPSTPGEYVFTLKVQDSSSPAIEATNAFTVRVTAVKLWIPENPTGNPTIGVPYANAFRGIGGRQPYQFSLIDGALLAGLSLNPATGAITGTTYSNQFYSARIRVTDSTDGTPGVAEGTWFGFPRFLGVSNPVFITGTGDIGLFRTSSLSRTFGATGGSGSYIWSSPSALPSELRPGFTAGLPPGVTVTFAGNTATMSGTPTTPGYYAFFLGVQDATNAANFSQQEVRMQVNALSISTPSTPVLNSGTAMSPYVLTTSGTRSGSTVTYSIVGGNLPPGLTMSAAGTITGTPSATGYYWFNVRATETLSGQPTYFRETGIAFQVYGPGLAPPLNVTGWPSDSRTEIGRSDHAINVTGGVPPYTYGYAPGATPIPGFQVRPAPSWYNSPSQGTLIGVATTAGVYTSRIRVTDSTGAFFDRDVKLTVTPVAFSFWRLRDASAGQPYSYQVTATGGTPPYTYSYFTTVSSSCGDLVINPSTGVLSGTPLSSCQYPLRVTDAAGSVRDQWHGLDVQRLRLISPTPSNRILPNATFNLAYSHTLNVAGGTAPYTFALDTNNQLPSGLTLSSSGTISGSPTSTGLRAFTILVTDAAGVRQSWRFNLSVSPNTPTPLQWSSFGEGTNVLGEDVGWQLWPSGGVPPYTYSLAPGSVLPDGISLRTTHEAAWSTSWDPVAALISGKMRFVGTQSFSLMVTDSVGNTATRTFRLRGLPLWLADTGMPHSGLKATVNQPFTQAMFAAGGTPPYTFSTTSTLPAGMNFAAGVLSGTPLTTGRQGYAVRVADSTGLVAEQPATNTNASLNVTAAGTANTLTFDTSWDQTLSTTGSILFSLTVSSTTSTPVSVPVDITLAPGSNLPDGLALLKGNALINPNSNTFAQLAGRPTTPGEYFFILRATDAAGGFGQKQFRFRVTRLGTNGTFRTTTSAGQSYSSQIAIVGATGPVTFSVTGGSLPPGLSFNPATGALTGTPTVPGTYSFTIEFNDGSGVPISRSFNVTVAPFAIVAATIPPPQLGVPYSFTFAADPATPPSGTYAWSWSFGQGSFGLSLDAATGTLSGTPSSTTNTTITVTLGNGTTSVSLVYRLVIQSPQSIARPEITSSPILFSDGTVGQAYGTTIGINGGTPPFTVSAPSPGLLPPGLSILPFESWSGGESPGNFLLAGVPTTAGTYTFPVQVTDGAGISARRTLTVRIGSHRLVNTQFAPGRVGVPYSAQLTAQNCAGACTFSVADIGPNNQLPPGLTLSPTGLISGTPLSTFSNISVTIQITSGTQAIYANVFLLIYGTTDNRQLSFGTNFQTADVPLGQNFNNTFSAGSTVSWSLTPGSTLPPGVSLLSGTTLPVGFATGSAVIAGAPTTAGTYTFGIRGEDALGNIGVRTYTLRTTKIDFAHNFVRPTNFGYLLAPGKVGAPFTQTIGFVNVSSPYTVSLGAGSFLPPGVTLSPAGVLSGTPTESGNFTLWINVSDASGATARLLLTWLVLPAGSGPGGINTFGSPVPALRDQPYSFELDQLIAFGYAQNPPFTWTIVSGALPAGLSLVPGSGSASARIEGTPTTTTSNLLYLKVTDSTGSSGVLGTFVTTHSWRFSPSSQEPLLPPASVGTNYTLPFTVLSGDTPPYSFVLDYFSGLPVGMTLSPSGVLSGTPLYANNHRINLRVTSSTGEPATRQYILRVGTTAPAPPNLTVTPSSIDLTWATGTPAPAPIPVQVTSSAGPLTITSNSTGGTWLSSAVTFATTPGTVTVNVNPAGLAAGIYNGTVTVSSTGAGNSPRTIPVKLTVSPTVACNYVLNAMAGNVAAAGGTVNIGLTTAASCNWTASSDATWATVAAPGSGTGGGTVQVTVEANASATARTATLTIGGQTYTLTQFGTSCSFSLGTPSLSPPSGGGAAVVPLTASGSSCGWTAVSDSTWIALGATSAAGTGSASINLTVTANTGAASRTGSVTVGGRTLSVTQAGTACTFGLSPAASSYAANGGGGSFDVTAGAGCAWSAASSDSWIKATPASGSGNQTVTLTIDPNSSVQARSGTVIIGGQAHTVTQAGLTCSYTLSSTNPVQPAGGGSGSVDVNAAGSGCAWTVSSNASWLTPSANSGGGNGTVSFNAAANAGTGSRSGTLTIAGQNLVVTQAGTTCSYSLRSASAIMPAESGTTSLGVVTAGSCAWTALSNAPWITASAAGSTGPGELGITVAPNTAATDRTGTLTVAGQTFSVTQTGAPCTVTITTAPPAPIVATGGTGVIAFTTSAAGCSPPILSFAGWVTVTGSSITGTSGTVNYSVSQNNLTTSRSGVVRIGSQAFTVSQQPSACGFSLTSFSASFGRDGGMGSVPFTATAGTCVPLVQFAGPGILIPGSLSQSGTSFEQGYAVQLFNAIVPYIRNAQIGVNGAIFSIKQRSW